MTLVMHTSRMASRSDPSPLVRIISKINLKSPTKPLSIELELDEEGTRISLNIVDTPGFGDHIDNEARYVKLSSVEMLSIRFIHVVL
jgi:septin family protein